MNNLSYFRYAVSFLKRDLTVTLLSTVLYGVLFYFFIFSIHIQNIIEIIPQKNPYGLLKISADLSVLLCIIVFIFISLMKILLKRGEIGIMVAVGGNRPGCVLLVTLESLLGILPGFALGILVHMLAGFPGIPAEMQDGSIMISSARAISYGILAVILFTAPATYVASLVDPYQFIKRQK